MKNEKKRRKQKKKKEKNEDRHVVSVESIYLLKSRGRKKANQELSTQIMTVNIHITIILRVVYNTYERTYRMTLGTIIT